MTLVLDHAQRDAIDHQHGPMLVLAGAGTGKTLVLVERMARLIHSGAAQPNEVLALTYTDNAAAEMRHRVAQRLKGILAGELQTATFHAYCFDLLKRAGRSFHPLATEDLWIYLRRRIAELPLRNFIKAANLSEFLHDLLRFFDRCHDELTSPDDYDHYLDQVCRGALPAPRVTKSSAPPLADEEVLERCREIAQTFRKVEEMLEADGLGTFGHMIVRAVQLLRSDAVLLARERRSAQYILLDEFQDANSAQITLAQLLAGDTANIFAVGDPDQAIYHFRGASSAAFDEFLRIFPNARRVNLDRNHRSTPGILAAAHALIERNSSEHRQPLVSARAGKALAEGREFRFQPVEAVLWTAREAEAADVAESIHKLSRSSRFRYSDCAVLYRQHTHRTELVRELAERGIPFAVVGLDALTAPEVRDLLACLRLVISPHDSTSLFRLVARPEFALDPARLHEELRGRRLGSLHDVAQRFDGGRALLQKLQEMLVLAQASEMNMLAAVDLAAKLFAIPVSAPTRALRDFVVQWEKKPLTKSPEVASFLDYLALFRESGGAVTVPVDEQDDAVQLMTAHSAKGLEFRHVFILRANTGSFPNSYHEALFEFPAHLRSSACSDLDSKAQHQQEERRLFYVAMTRARDTLAIYAKPGKGQRDPLPAGYLRELLRDRGLSASLRSRSVSPLQLEIEASAERASPVTEWLYSRLPPVPTALELSATAVERYQRCPLQFKIEREWRLPPKPTAALQFGGAMHTALKLYGDRVLSHRSVAVAELVQAFHDVFDAAQVEDPVQRRLYEQQAERQLGAFHQTHASASPEVISTERSFVHAVAGIKIRGRVDRLDRLAPNTVAVVDYKTGSPRSQEDADESLQLSLYALGVRAELRLNPEKLIFYNLETGTEVVTVRSEQQLGEAADLVADVASNIAAGNFDPKPGYHCRWCAYREICPTQEERLYSIQPAAAVAGRVN